MGQKLVWSVDGADWPNRATSRFVEAAGYRWHVQVMGDGPVALLAHGTGAATHTWRALGPLLAQKFTIVAPDLPGHGFTQSLASRRLSLPGMARDLGALCKSLAVEPAIAIGHSAGAAILARMSLDRMIEPKLLVSLNGAFLPFGGFATQFLSPLAKALTYNPFVPRVFAWRGRQPAAVRRLIAGTGSSIDAEGERLYGTLVASSAHVAAALEMMAYWDLRPLVRDLRGLRADLLLVAASNDRAVPPDMARQIQKIVPGAKLEILGNCGHLAHEEAPAATAALVMRAAAASGVFAAQHQM
jgi:magnesium chelatase accessory protein